MPKDMIFSGMLNNENIKDNINYYSSTGTTVVQGSDEVKIKELLKDFDIS